MCLYGRIIDREWLSLLFSYFGLVNCMDKRRHEIIVYKKLWPNMDSKLWICTTLTDFRVYRHIPTHLHYDRWFHTTPLKLTKNAWLCAKPVCCYATSDASMPLDESFDHNWAFISFVISRGSHHGLLPKRDKVAESTHTNGLIFWGSCSPNCRSTASNIVGPRGHLGWNIKGLSWLCRSFPWAALGSEDQARGPVQHPVLSLVWPSRKEVYKCRHPEQQTFEENKLNPSSCLHGCLWKMTETYSTSFG